MAGRIEQRQLWEDDDEIFSGVNPLNDAPKRQRSTVMPARGFWARPQLCSASSATSHLSGARLVQLLLHEEEQADRGRC